MTINSDDKYKVAIVARWLRKCTDGQDNCDYCPFGDGDLGDNTESYCVRKLNTTAADLLEKLAGLRQ